MVDSDDNFVPTEIDLGDEVTSGSQRRKTRPARSTWNLAAFLVIAFSVTVVNLESILRVIDEADPDTSDATLQAIKGDSDQKSDSPEDTQPPQQVNTPGEAPSQTPEEQGPRLSPVIHNSLGMKFCLIPPGEFLMGSLWSETKDEDEKPHSVKISTPYYLAAFEVTQKVYAEVTGQRPSHYSRNGGGAQSVAAFDTEEFPVEQVSWTDAIQFCALLELQNVERIAGNKYRLPTEAEWEYACRAHTATPFFTGADLGTADSAHANCDRNSDTSGSNKRLNKRRNAGHPVAVGGYLPNDFGLCDMHGNVWEWCSDMFDSKYYARSPTVDPPGPDFGYGRVIRGGSFHKGEYYCRSAYRVGWTQTDRANTIGFRVVLIPGDPLEFSE